MKTPEICMLTYLLQPRLHYKCRLQHTPSLFALHINSLPECSSHMLQGLWAMDCIEKPITSDYMRCKGFVQITPVLVWPLWKSLSISLLLFQICNKPASSSHFGHSSKHCQWKTEVQQETREQYNQFLNFQCFFLSCWATKVILLQFLLLFLYENNIISLSCPFHFLEFTHPISPSNTDILLPPTHNFKQLKKKERKRNHCQPLSSLTDC